MSLLHYQAHCYIPFLGYLKVHYALKKKICKPHLGRTTMPFPAHFTEKELRAQVSSSPCTVGHSHHSALGNTGLSKGRGTFLGQLSRTHYFTRVKRQGWVLCRIYVYQNCLPCSRSQKKQHRVQSLVLQSQLLRKCKQEDGGLKPAPGKNWRPYLNNN